jgi:periplasmic protein CpxP/Spy
MSFRFKRIVLATLGGLAAIVTLGAMTGCGGHAHGRYSSDPAAMAERQAKMVNYASRKLDLNEVQKKHLSALADKLQQQRAALAGGDPDPRDALKALVAGDKLDRTKAQALVNDKTSAIQSKSPELIAAAADFYDSLNPAQQQQVRDLMNRRRGWGG